MSGYTFGEKLTRARLLAQGGRRAHLGLSTGRIDDRLDALEDRAYDRDQREEAAREAAADRARNDVAAAKVAVRAARGSDKRAARDRVREAERALRRLR